MFLCCVSEVFLIVFLCCAVVGMTLKLWDPTMEGALMRTIDALLTLRGLVAALGVTAYFLALSTSKLNGGIPCLDYAYLRE